MKHAVYHPDKGEIIQFMTGGTRESIMFSIGSLGLECAEAEDDTTQHLHYVAAGEVALRPVSPATLSGTTLDNLPAPCTIAINGHGFPCADAAASLSLPPGEYAITVSAWPYLDAHFSLRI